MRYAAAPHMPLKMTVGKQYRHGWLFGLNPIFYVIIHTMDENLTNIYGKIVATEIEYERSFFQLFNDSIMLHQHANQYLEIDDFRSTLFRASILNTLLIPEAVANICIEHLNLERSVYYEIDRLPVLAKFDYYLRTNFRNKFLDRGIVEIEGLKELKRLRDDYVHPKHSKIYWNIDENGSGTGECEKTKLLKFNKAPSFWEKDDSFLAMVTVHRFLHYFFMTKCRFTKAKVASLLFSLSHDPNEKDYKIPCWPKSFKEELKSQGITIDYVKIIWY
ncbi:MAG: hypothetical protein HQK72_02340 [Desulfamplus sp.]|nr:hypothetical protein [Desulfamplus sp.]